MENTILHMGGFTAVLESNGTVSTRDQGRLPTLDDIARQRARARYMSEEEYISAPGSTSEYKEGLGMPWPTSAYTKGEK